MNVLMTGVTGFIGSHLAERLLLDGNDVHAIVRPSSRVDSLSDFLQRRVKFHVCDESRSVMDIVTRTVTRGGGKIRIRCCVPSGGALCSAVRLRCPS